MKHIMGLNTKSKLTEVKDEDIQPNAVDLRVDKIFIIYPHTFTITNNTKSHRGTVELKPNEEGFWTLQEGSYEIVMENIIHVGENEAGWVITRSTLIRNGVFITGGLYDSGYNGVMAAVLNVTCGPMTIQRGTRVGQFLLFDAQALHKYKGDYGLDSEHDKKYTGEVKNDS